MPDDQSPSPASPEPTNSSYGRLFGAASPPPMPTPPGNWEPPLPDEVSAMLSGYVVTGVLGRGGMGAVYQGVQTSLERPVAIKLLPPELGYDPEFEARFRREAKSMARLNHPNIVQIYDFGTTGSGHHYIVMEFVDGTDLHRLIRSGGLTPEGALNAVSQICDALEYAHGEGFVHRDIKPANIFINNKGILKVGDFGLAKLVEGADESALSATENLGLTMTGVAMGTPHYIAPEQLAADGTVDRRADIYSLGVMFYEMLTGELPRGAVKPPSQKVKALDVRLDDVVFRAMEVDPAERYQSAMDLRTDVDGIRLTPMEVVPSSEPAETRSRSVSTAVPRREKATRDRRMILWSGIAVALLLAVGVVGWKMVSGGGADVTTAEVSKDSLPSAGLSLEFPITLSRPGRLEAMGTSATADFLKLAEPHADFVQVCASSTASGEAVIWAALRQNGEVVFSEGDAHRPATPAKNVALIRSDRGSGFFLIHRDGSLTVTGEAAVPPAGLKPVVDAAGGGERIALALHTDRSVTVWGEGLREWPVPAEALKEVVSLSASRYGAMTVTADGGLHRWGRDYPYRRIEAPAGDPFVEVMGAWTVPQEGKVRSRSGKLFSVEGVPAVIEEIADDLAYGGPVFYRDRQGFWRPMADGGAEFRGMPEFSKGHEVAAFVSAKKAAAMLRIVPVDKDSSLTSSPASQTLFDRIAGKKYYRATNAANWLSFGPKPGQMVLRDLEGKDIVYECKALSGNEVEWRWGNGDRAVARFDEDLNRVTLPTGVAFSTTPGLVFATEAEELSHYVGGSEWQVESKDKPYSIWFNESATSFRTASGEEYPLTDSGKPFRKLFRWQNVDSDNFVEFKQTYEIGYFFDANTGDGAVVMKRQGAVPRNMPVNEGSDLTSSSAKTDLVARISGKKYYRATNAAEWFRFGPKPGQMVLHNLQGKDNFYEFKALSENEIEWRFSSGPVTGRFEEGVERFVLPDGTFFSTTPGPAFATETEEIAHHVGGSEWQVESKSGGYSIWFNESATAIRTKAGPEYPLEDSEQSYRRLFRWKDAVEDNEIKFDLTYESGHFFDAAAKEGSVPMKRLGPVPAGGLSITNATPSIRSGRLRAFGFYFDNDKRFPVEQPDGGSDYVACSSESGPWQAVRANGDLVVGHERHRPDPPFTTIPPEGLIGSQNVALNREGRLLTWSDHIRNRVGELERVELFDAQHRFAAAKFKNGDIRIWNILPEESPETYQPTREELGDVVKIVAANCGVTFLRRDGTILFCNQVGVRKTLVDRDRFVEIDNVVNGFVGLTENGEVKDWGNSDRVEARDDLPRITAIRGGGRIVAALREDGTWTSWAADDTQEGAKTLQEKLSTIRGAIDLDVYADKQVARMAWIEAVETTKSPPAEAVTSVTPTATEMPGRAAVPADAITNRITGIDAAYHQRYEAEVTKPHAEAVEKLNGQISAALQREQDAASKAGELDEVLQWRRSIDRLGSGQGVPTVAEIAAEAPPVVRPPKLLGFYATYRDLLGKLEAARDEKVKPLRAARDQALDQYQRELTQAGNIDGALRVKAAREAVPDNTPAPEAKAEPATAPAAAWPSDDDGSLLAANRRRYQIDYSRSGTLKVAGTIGSNGEESPVPQPTADEAKDVCFVAARYENGGGWMAVKKNGEVVTPMTGKFAVPGSVKKPRWLDVGNQAIAVNEDGSVTIWGEGDWRPKQVLRRVVKAESGHENSIALHEDGTVSVWGPMYNRFTPDPDWLQDAVDVAAGSVRAFVLKADGRVVGWNADGDLTKQDFRNSPKLGSEYDTSFGGMKNLVAISGNHRGVIGLDNSGRWVNHEKTITPIEGLLKHVTSGYMLACGVTSEGRIFLENLDQGKRRFPIAADAALAARDVISVAGAGDGTDPKFHGFLAWVEADELSQTEPGGLLLLGYRQIEDGTKEEDFPQMELKPGEKVIAVGARNRHGGGYVAWTDQKRRVSRMGDMEVDDGRLIARADSDFQHGFLMRDGTLKLSGDPVPGMADELKGIVDFDLNGYSAVAVVRDGGVIVWTADAGPDRVLQPDSRWLGDLVAARSGFEPGHWWFLRRDGTVGHSGVKGVILDSAFSEPVHVIAPTRVSACLALTRDGRIIHNADPNFTNPLLLKQIPNDRGPFVDLRCGGDVAAAQRPDGSWIAWGAEREKDLALFRELEASGPVRDLRIKGVGGNTTPNGAGNLVIIGIHPEGE